MAEKNVIKVYRIMKTVKKMNLGWLGIKIQSLIRQILEVRTYDVDHVTLTQKLV